MKRMLRISALLMAGLLSAAALGGCAKKAEVASLPQFDQEIKEGEEIAVITVKDYGEIKIRFFADKAPKAVENFIELAKKGYYNELNFHRVMKDFMIQGGDPKGDGSGGESKWGTGFEVEADNELRHFRGALSMAHSSEPNSNGSQFFIVQNSQQYTDKELDQIEASRQENAKTNNTEYLKMADKVREKYKEVGGTPALDDSYTVFGQVYEGMDVVDKIAACKVKAVSSSNGQSENSKPVEEVLIQKVEILPYKK